MERAVHDNGSAPAEPAYEVNEKRTREKNDGNEKVSMDDDEKIEIDSERGPSPRKIGIIPSKTRYQNGRNQTYKKRPEEVRVRKQA